MACDHYRPDHNGECLTCDEPADAHGWQESAASEAQAADLYATMTSDELRRLRVAFLTDRAHVTSVRSRAFCDARVALVTAELHRRKT